MNFNLNKIKFFDTEIATLFSSYLFVYRGHDYLFVNQMKKENKFSFLFFFGFDLLITIKKTEISDGILNEMFFKKVLKNK